MASDGLFTFCPLHTGRINRIIKEKGHTDLWVFLAVCAGADTVTVIALLLEVLQGNSRFHILVPVHSFSRKVEREGNWAPSHSSLKPCFLGFPEILHTASDTEDCAQPS